MLLEKDRIRIEYKTYSGVKQIQYVHLCIDCNSEMCKTAQEEKTSTGYCIKCMYNHRKKRINDFNDIGEKWCSYCKRFLPTNKFIKKAHSKKGFSTACSKCHNLKPFGITALEYEMMHKKQNGKCAICGKPESANDKHKTELRQLAVDHCHKKGKVRGLLCTNCNLGIGQFKDSISILKKAIKYLKLNKLESKSSNDLFTYNNMNSNNKFKNQ